MSEQSRFEDEVFAWWKSLSNDTGSRAQMRRQPDILGIMMNERFYDLVRKAPYVDKDTLACIAMAVCHIDSDCKETLAELMGRKTQTSDHRVSERRFHRLIESDSEEAARMIIRILPMVDSRANVRDMAVRIRYWDNDQRYSQKRWIENYYLSNTKKEEE